MLICLQTNAMELRCKGTHFIGNLQNFDLKMIVNFNI